MAQSVKRGSVEEFIRGGGASLNALVVRRGASKACSFVVALTLTLGLCPSVAFASPGACSAEGESGEPIAKEVVQPSSEEGKSAVSEPSEKTTSDQIKSSQDIQESNTQEEPAVDEEEAEVSTLVDVGTEAADGGEEAEVQALSEKSEEATNEISAEELIALSTPDGSESVPVREDEAFVGAIAPAACSALEGSKEPAFEALSSDKKTTTIDGVTYTYYDNDQAQFGPGIYIVDTSWAYTITVPDKIDGKNVVSFVTRTAWEANRTYHLDASKASALKYIFSPGLMTLNVSNNPALQEVHVMQGSLESIDVRNCPKLQVLECSYNKLSSIDVSRNHQLVRLYLNANYLTHLDVSKNVRLGEVGAKGNYLDNAKALGKRFDVGGGWMSNEGVNPQCDKTSEGFLVRPYGTGTAEIVGYVGVSRNPVVPATVVFPKGQDTGFYGKQIIVACKLVIGDPKLDSLDARKATGLESIDCQSNNLSSLLLPSSASLTFVDCDDNNLTSLDVSKNPKLQWLSCAANHLTNLDVSKNPELIQIVTGGTVYGTSTLMGNDITSLDVSKNPKLEFLLCAGSGIAKLDLSKNPLLINLFCMSNAIETLDVSKNPRLELLECYENLLTKLDVSVNKSLKELLCYNNYIADTKALTSRFGSADKVILPQFKSMPSSRLAGDIALDTMASITREGFSSSSTVIIATLSGYWDALTASSLAGLNECPILLTDGSTLSSQTASEVKRLGASKVYIAGGTAAVSSKVESSLKSLSGVKTVKRLAGDTAIGTALKIYEEGKGAWGTTAVIATSETFQDALSVSPYAFAKRAPIFLANATTHTLDSRVLSAVKSGGFERIVIVGGTAALSSQIESQQLKGISCVRLAGATAYETSSAIASWCLTQGMVAANVGVATGTDYYDALAGAALCGRNNSVLVLVSDSNLSSIESFIAPNKGSVRHAYVFGGPAAVSPKTYNAITTALR